jgi:hypothetical protein
MLVLGGDVIWKNEERTNYRRGGSRVRFECYSGGIDIHGSSSSVHGCFCPGYRANSTVVGEEELPDSGIVAT